ncbi:MAG TPA: hypothetical protein VMW72_11895 [Sedimentisphaerales bacterium]|nr:hypothetical protein [Sedimentisphaerales bacterium]
MAKQQAYIRHFIYEPSKNGYEEYVTSFFNSSNLDIDWDIFVKKVAKSGIKRRTITTQIKRKRRQIRGFKVQKAWYYWQAHNDKEYILAFVNSMGSCSLRRFKAEGGEQLERLPNKKGNYQDKFSEYLRAVKPLSLSRQPNLERDCKERLPEWVMAELREQISDYRMGRTQG